MLSTDNTPQVPETIQVEKTKYQTLLGRVLGIRQSEDGNPPAEVLARLLRNYSNKCTENNIPEVLEDLGFVQEYFNL